MALCRLEHAVKTLDLMSSLVKRLSTSLLIIATPFNCFGYTSRPIITILMYYAKYNKKKPH